MVLRFDVPDGDAETWYKTLGETTRPIIVRCETSLANYSYYSVRLALVTQCGLPSELNWIPKLFSSSLAPSCINPGSSH